MTDHLASGRPERTIGTGGSRGETPRHTVLFIGGDAKCSITLARITRLLESVDLVVAEDVREARLLAVSLAPSLILLDTQIRASDAHELLAYLGRAAMTARMPLAVSSGSEHEPMDWLLRSIDCPQIGPAESAASPH